MYIKKNISLKAYNTFGINAKAKFFTEIRHHGILKQLYVSGITGIKPLLILGSGSNVLFSGNYDGLVLLNNTRGMLVLEEDEEQVLVEVSSGESWSDFVDYTLDKAWYGLENLSLIPGTVGAAPIQNIGAFGFEVKDFISEVKAFDLDTGRIRKFSNEDCEFTYRNSIFKSKYKGRFFILSVSFILSKKAEPKIDYGRLKAELEGIDPITPIDVSQAVKNVRRSKLPDPEDLNNAGSFFKNPEVDPAVAEDLRKQYPDMPVYPTANQKIKLAAGWLIEHAGWKGKKMGKVGVHKNQALVLINYGGASGSDILNLSAEIGQSVFRKFGVELEPEVNII